MKKNLVLALLLVAGAALAAHAARMTVSGAAAQKMWAALNLMGKLEDLQLHVVDGATDTITVRSLACASEMYDACSMFVTVNGAEKMIVHLDAAPKIIDALYDFGIYPYEDDPSMSQTAQLVSCSKTGESYDCVVKEWQKR